MAARRVRWLLLLVVVLLALAEATAAAQDPAELTDGLMTLVGPDGAPLLQTGLPLHPGDRFLDATDRWWQVDRVEGNRALAAPAGVRAGGISRRTTPLTLLPSIPSGHPAALAGPDTGPAPRVLSADAPADVDVVIYHTHSDESYLPGDGTASTEGRGGIFQVGASLAAALEAAGLRVAQRPEDHYPHDPSAYVRSRRTALAALADQQPTLLLDVHRDAGPAASYRFAPGGEAASRVLLVIGGSNPARESNLALAGLVKEQADLAVPGLVKGIFMGRGVYNQDLTPRALLLEVGTENTPRMEAERGVALLGGAIASVLKELGRPGSPAAREEERAAWGTILWLAAAVTLAAAGGLVLISGGWRQAANRVANWRRELWDPLRRR